MNKKGRKAAWFGMILTVLLLAGCKKDTSAQEQLNYRNDGIKCMDEKNYSGAIKAFQKALDEAGGKVGNTELDVCYYKAQAQAALGDIKGAEKTYTAIIEYDKKAAEAYYLRGNLYLQQKKESKALDEYEKAGIYAETNIDIYLGICQSLLDAGLDQQADAYAQKAGEITPETPQERTKIGKIYLMQEKYDEAQQQLEQALSEGDIKANLYLAELYFLDEAPDEAMEFCKAYADAKEKDASALNDVGELLLKNGKTKEALEYFQQGIETGKEEDLRILKKNEIIALEKNKDFVGAKEKIAAYCEEYPDDAEAKKEETFLSTR